MCSDAEDQNDTPATSVAAFEPKLAYRYELDNPTVWRRYALWGRKWGDGECLGSGYSFAQAKAISQVLWKACAEARPFEDAWTKPHFAYEVAQAAIRSRTAVGDLVIYQLDHDFRDLPHGAQVFTRSHLPGIVEAVSAKGRVERVRNLHGESVVAPKIMQSFARDDIELELFIAALLERERQLEALSPGYRFLAKQNCVLMILEQYALNIPQPTEFNFEQAFRIASTLGQPQGHEPGKINEGAVRKQIEAILAEPTVLKEAA